MIKKCLEHQSMFRMKINRAIINNSSFLYMVMKASKLNRNLGNKNINNKAMEFKEVEGSMYQILIMAQREKKCIEK